MSSKTNRGNDLGNVEQHPGAPLSTQPELSSQVVDALQSLVKHVKSTASAFACGGLVSENKIKVKDVTLFYQGANK
jgi:galactose-1-phosphate uridylyltransferase